MAHFARLDDNNIVTEVTVVNNVDIHFLPFPESEAFGVQICRDVTGHQKWKQTSYNNNFRGNYAGIGFTYDSTNDVFYDQQPFASWTLDTSSWKWQPPLAYPTDGNVYYWDEDAYQADNTQGWVTE
jgi:hypothetical protein